MIKFDVNDYYTQAMSGEAVDPAPLTDFIKSFPQVILWGASVLGQAVRKCLHKQGVKISCFWDLRYMELQDEVDGTVTAPFKSGNPKDTLVILCVGNTILHPEMIGDLIKNGYEYLLGDYIYQGIGCPHTVKTGVTADACLRGCCRAIYCNRLSNIVKAKCHPKSDPSLFLHSITIVVNQLCSLSCKYCTSYMNRYPQNDRINFNAEKVIEDITTFFKAVDGVGTITIMGGEPFLHPDISEITQSVLDCGNFGVISISTSGTCVIKPKQLLSLKDKRVNISFSNYLSSLSQHQQSMFYKNISLMKEEGIPFTIGAPGPFWIIPSTLNAQTLTVDQLIQRKNGCNRIMQIKNNMIHPCDFANAVHGLKLQYYPDSMIAISNDHKQLRNDIISFFEQDVYSVCERCKGYGGSTCQAAEQGFVDLLNG